MIRRITRLGNCGMLVAAAVFAIIFLLFGLLNLWDIIRTDLKAFASYDLLKFRPNIEENEPPYLDDLVEINKDTTAWITLYRTNIDYPIMQGKTDMEYLNKDAYGDYSISGSIFLSVLNKKDYSEPYQLVYGHHMQNGSMFGDIDKFKNADFFYNANNRRFKEDEGVLIMPNKAYDLYVYALLYTDAYDPMVYRADKSKAEMKELLAYIEENAEYKRDVGKIDHLMALSTCDGGTSTGRTVLFLKVETRKRPLPSRETEPLELHREAVGHPMAGAYWALFNLLILVMTAYLMFPAHLIKKMEYKKHIGYTVLALLIGISSVIMFILTEDIHKPIDIVDQWTPLMLAIMLILWIVQRMRLRSIEKAQESKNPDNAAIVSQS